MEEKEILNAQNEEEIGDDEVVQLVTEDGETLDFFFVASIEYKGEWFAFFQPAEPMADIEEDEIVIFKIAEENDFNEAQKRQLIIQSLDFEGRL